MTINTALPGDVRDRPALLPDPLGRLRDHGTADASAVSWGAVFAGAAGAAALSLILLMLGVGLGMSSISPWTNQGASAATIGTSTILWITLTQLLASGLGGYLAGRLRTKWASVHGDEVYFRDTAHGFLSWSVATLVTAALLGSAIGSIVGGSLQAGASAVSGAGSALAGTASAAVGGAAAKPGTSDMGSGYFLDSLFRRSASAAAPAASAADVQDPTTPAGSSATPPTSNASAAAEIGRIFSNSVSSGSLPADDVRQAGQLVSQSTGLSQPEAEKRVTDTYARLQTKLRDAEAAARDAADKARKASAYAALWLFISLLIGAFTASWAATFGGKLRDT